MSDENNINLNHENFIDLVQEIYSKNPDRTRFKDIAFNTCLYVMSILTEPGTKTHRNICGCAEKDGVNKKGFTYPDFTGELRRLEKDGFIEKIQRGSKIAYRLSPEGSALMESLPKIGKRKNEYILRNNL